MYSICWHYHGPLSENLFILTQKSQKPTPKANARVIGSNFFVQESHEGWQECKSPACHSERERRISHAGHRDSSLTLRMTMQSRFVSSPNHRISDEINCWSQNDTTKQIRPFSSVEHHICIFMLWTNYKA